MQLLFLSSFSTDICIHTKACQMTTQQPLLQRSDCTTLRWSFRLEVPPGTYFTNRSVLILMVAKNVYAASSFHYAYARDSCLKFLRQLIFTLAIQLRILDTHIIISLILKMSAIAKILLRENFRNYSNPEAILPTICPVMCVLFGKLEKGCFHSTAL